MDGNSSYDRTSFSSVVNGVRRVMTMRSGPNRRLFKGTNKLPNSLKKGRSGSLRSVSFDSIVGEDQLPGYGSVNNPNLIGVIMPMGHGKSYHHKEGWLDIDNLITHEMREKMTQQIAEDMVGGSTYDEAVLRYLPHISAVIQMMDIEDRTLVTCNSHALLKGLGIPISGTLILEQEAFEENIRGRSEWQKNLSRANKMVAQLGYRDEHVIMVDDNDEMHAILYRMCEVMEIPRALPRLYDHDAEEDVATGAGEGVVDIEEVYKRYRNGDVAYQTLCYQVKSLGLDTYKYMGKDINDWAQCGAKVVHARGKVIGMSGYDSWPMRVKELIRSRQVKMTQEVDAIIKAHDGEPERFLCTLLIHWELSGSKCEARVLPLYLVRLSAWNSVQSMVGKLARSSGTLFGKVLIGEARGLVVNLAELSLCTRSAIRSQKLATEHTNTSKHNVKTGGVKKAYAAFRLCNSQRLEQPINQFGVWLSKSRLECAKQTSLRAKDGTIGNIEGICCSYWMIGQDADDVKLAKIESVLSGVGPADQSWDNTINKLLEKEYSTKSSLSRLLTLQGPSWIEGAQIGSDISRIVAGMCSHLLSNGLVSGELGVELVQSVDKGTGRLLFVAKCTDAQFYTVLGNLNLGRNVGLAPSSGLGNICKIGNMIDWSRSLNGLALELANTDQWLGPNLMNRDKVALIGWWISYLDQFPEKRDVISGFLDMFCKDWFNCRFDNMTESEVRSFCSISRRDGGLGAGEVVFTGEIDNSDNWMPGTGGIITTGIKREVDYTHCDMLGVESATDEDAYEKTGFWSATSLVKVGPMMSMLLRCESRNEHRSVAGNLEMLVADRIHRDNRPPPLKLQADEIEEPEDE